MLIEVSHALCQQVMFAQELATRDEDNILTMLHQCLHLSTVRYTTSYTALVKNKNKSSLPFNLAPLKFKKSFKKFNPPILSLYAIRTLFDSINC